MIGPPLLVPGQLFGHRDLVHVVAPRAIEASEDVHAAAVPKSFTRFHGKSPETWHVIACLWPPRTHLTPILDEKYVLFPPKLGVKQVLGLD